MRTFPLALALMLALSMMVLTNVVSAEGGVGACAAGTGADLSTSAAPAFVGVNVGFTNSTSGAYASQQEFEAQCCAEGDMAPECFAPAA